MDAYVDAFTAAARPVAVELLAEVIDERTAEAWLQAPRRGARPRRLGVDGA